MPNALGWTYGAILCALLAHLCVRRVHRTARTAAPWRVLCWIAGAIIASLVCVLTLALAYDAA